MSKLYNVIDMKTNKVLIENLNYEDACNEQGKYESTGEYCVLDEVIK